METALKIAGLALWGAGYFLGIARGRSFNGQIFQFRRWPPTVTRSAIKTYGVSSALVVAGGLVLGSLRWSNAEIILMGLYFPLTIGQLFKPDAGRILQFLRVPFLVMLANIGVFGAILIWQDRW